MQVALLQSRALDMLALGDISAARLLYRRAAALGSAQAATALGRTYDPAYLAATKATGIQPDSDAAAAWYSRGAALGDPEAANRLASLGSIP
jgi:TPR repeat protein